MIDVNLMPGDKRKRRNRNGLLPSGFVLPREVIIGLIGGFLVVLSLWHILLQVIVISRYVQLKGLEGRWEKLLPEKTEVDALIKELTQRQARIKTINQVRGDQGISWAQKLQAISMELPRGVWLRNLLFDEGTLLINGSSVSKHKVEMINVHTFVSKLKEDAGFMKGVQAVELESIKNREVAQVTVADFIIRVVFEEDKINEKN
ncbi:MAG: PilN domain-containing protein [Candidatus Omnitrophota bacterium]